MDSHVTGPGSHITGPELVVEPTDDDEVMDAEDACDVATDPDVLPVPEVPERELESEADVAPVDVEASEDARPLDAMELVLAWLLSVRLVAAALVPWLVTPAAPLLPLPDPPSSPVVEGGQPVMSRTAQKM